MKSSEATVPCPGCGGRGRFEWPQSDKVPRQWSPDAACGMCGGKGQVPASWLKGKKAVRQGP
ncbi:MAG: primase-helicase zinc-binding domain-containing protein [Candidatus Methylomirabilales bacterium]